MPMQNYFPQLQPMSSQNYFTLVAAYVKSNLLFSLDNLKS